MCAKLERKVNVHFVEIFVVCPWLAQITSLFGFYYENLELRHCEHEKIRVLLKEALAYAQDK